MKKANPYLRYIGDGAFLPGVPARDLTEAEVKQYALADLLSSGLYEEIKSQEPAKKPVEEDQWEQGSES